MRPAALLALALAALLALSLPARAAPSAMEAPAWTPGDSWTYRFNTTFEGFAYLNGTVRAEVLALQNATVRGASVETYLVDTTGNGTLEASFTLGTTFRARGGWNLTGEERFAADTRVIVTSLFDITGEGRVQVLGTPFSLHWINSTESVVVGDTWRYPVPLGGSGAILLNTSWSEDVFARLDQNGTWSNRTGVSEIGIDLSLGARPGSAAVPAGTFETFAVDEAWPDGTHERFEYAPLAGNNARTLTTNATGGELSRTELVSYRYQALEPGAGVPLWAVAAGVAAAAALVLLAAWALRRRRAREEAYTPPSLRDPPPT